jgi:hypothetical protein
VATCIAWLTVWRYVSVNSTNSLTVCTSLRLQFPLQDDTAALKAVALAQRHGLTGAAAGLARRLGMAAAAGGRSAAALQWFMRAHDPARCAELVAPLLGKVQQQLLEQVGVCCAQVL